MSDHTPSMQAVAGGLGFDALDKRTRSYRRLVTIRDNVYADLGGEGGLSEVQRQLVARFANVALILEQMDAASLTGESINVDLYGRTAGQMRRLGEALGLKRVPIDVSPDAREAARRAVRGQPVIVEAA